MGAADSFSEHFPRVSQEGWNTIPENIGWMQEWSAGLRRLGRIK
jgi:hypothetical protein